jgi:hypothetical protein
MDSVALRNVDQLPSAEKRSIENLVGRQLEDNQQVFILAFTPGVAPSDKARAEAMSGLVRTWEKVQRHKQERSVSDEEFDAAVDEAVEHVRRRQD